MNESELQKKVDRDALITGAKKAIKRAEQKKFDSQSNQPKMVKAYDKRTGQARFVPESQIMRNPSGFTPISGTVADMLRTSDRKKEERRIRKGRDRNLRIERLKQVYGSKIKPRPGKTKAFKIGGAIADKLKTDDRRIERKIRRESNERTAKKTIKKLTQGASPLTKSIIKKATEREPGGRLSRTDIKLAEQSLKNKLKIGGAMLKNPGKADLDKDGKLSGYEKKRGMAIEKAMAGKPQKALLGKLFRKKSGKATPGVMMIEGSPGGMGGLLRKLLKGKKFSKGGGKDMGSRQAMQDKLDKVNKDPILKRLRPDRKKLLEMLDRTKPTPKPLAKRMGGGLTEATNRLRAQGKMGGGMMNTMGYKKGKSVMAKGCKMGRKKPTKLY